MNNDKDKLIVCKWESVTVFDIANTVSLATVVGVDFDVLGIIHFYAKTTTCFSHTVDTLVSSIVVICAVHQNPLFLLQVSWICVLYPSAGIVFP